jgi:hypothetical protein
VIDTLADAFFPGQARNATELTRLFAHRGGFRWGLAVGLAFGALVGILVGGGAL